jgi:hypothetical protein
MKLDINRLTLWTAFLKTPNNEEIQQAANEMKGGKGYLFRDENGNLEMYNRRRLNDYAARNKTFIKRILATI